ncbi:hypothetical protein GCM10011371_33150 [Novosphingobium marinum]|nr:hypothetical protein GCM10011371_33150 [Novosphingobium marinum]
MIVLITGIIAGIVGFLVGFQASFIQSTTLSLVSAAILLAVAPAQERDRAGRVLSLIAVISCGMSERLAPSKLYLLSAIWADDTPDGEIRSYQKRYPAPPNQANEPAKCGA